MAAKPAFATGAQVEHAKFGPGTVLSCNEDYIVIKFDELGKKKFISSIALPSVRKIDRQPPSEKKKSRAKKTAAPATK
jgi:hypothetical protein